MREVTVRVGGSAEPAGARETVEVRSPATGALLARMARASADDIDHAVVAARSAAGRLAAWSPRERAALVRATGDALAERAEIVAHDLAAEQGKPLREAAAEVAAAVSMWHEAAEIVRHLGDDILPSDDPARAVVVVRRPHGVVAVITPWNFPATIPTEYLCAALVAGNAVVWKPSELTPLTAAHLLDCIDTAGWPAGAVNLVPGLGHDTGAALTAHQGVDAIGFTGSPQTGASIARAAGTRPVLLELGGNNATVVLEDVDIADVAARLAVASFANAGQICSSTERVVVHRDIYDQLAEALVERARSLRLGPSLDPATTLGPLNNEPTAAKVDDHVADAVGRGAEVLTGGRRAPGHPTPLFYEPTVLRDLAPGMRVFAEETFGPIVGLVPFDGDDDAVALVNGHRLGLVAGVLATDGDRALAIGRRLEAGIVNIGDVATSWQPHTPFGGWSGRSSGVGRLGGRYTIEAMSQLQTFVLPRGRMP